MTESRLFAGKTELRLTPFHARTAELCQAQEWRRWSGYLAASAYDLTPENEYFAIRTTAGLLDVTPLHKYMISGRDAAPLLNRIVTRNISKCKLHQVMYTPWCDEKGKVIDDGTVQHLEENKFRLTSADPNLHWLTENSSGMDVKIRDDSETTAALALQGPNSRDILNQISTVNLDKLKFFYLTHVKLGDIPVTVSRTGYTGDLGYEIWTERENALAMWDLIMETGKPHGITPAGIYALDIARIEAGLILIEVDYISAHHAIIDARESSPYELGLGWAVKLKKGDFIGKKALLKEKRQGPAWQFQTIEIEWIPLEKLYRNIGLPPQLPTTAWRTSTPIYVNKRQVGYATSGCWSPLLKKYIALAHLETEYSKIGTQLKFEVKVEHYRHLTPATVMRKPAFDPERKRSCP